MSKLVVLFWMIFGSFIIRYSNCFSLKTFDQNSISLTFSDSKFVQLSGGQLVRELNCTYNCKIKVKEVTCNRQDDTLIWICNSLSLDKSNYVFNSTLIVCDNYYSSNTNQSTTNCFMQYSLKCKYKEFDFVLLLVILLCFVLIAMFIEFLKKMFGCYSKLCSFFLIFLDLRFIHESSLSRRQAQK